MNEVDRAARLKSAVEDERRAAEELSRRTETRDLEFAAAVADGWSYYRIHKATGVAQSAVAKSARRAQER